jgi:glycerophosphoryl diester phosphodiesterase
MVFCLLPFMLTYTLLQAPPPFDLQGHRGCRGLLPENSMPAFLKALDIGVTTLELDVVISKDKQVVVSHEASINPALCLGPTGHPLDKKQRKRLNIYQMTYAEISQYDCGSRGNPAFPNQQRLNVSKPLLRDVIQQVETYCRDHRLPAVSYSIELKSAPSQYGISQPEPAEFSALVQQVIQEQLPPARVILQSFDFNILRYWKGQISAGKYAPVRLSALVSKPSGVDAQLEELGFLPEIYSPGFRWVTRKKVRQLHEKGIKIIPWTVNSLKQMRKLKGWGVDGLITDYPDRGKLLD